MKKHFILSIMVIIALLALPACAETVTTTVTATVTAAPQSTPSVAPTTVPPSTVAPPADNTELQAKYQELSSQYASLQTKYNDLTGQYEAVQAKYKELDSEYRLLNIKYDQMQEGVTGIDAKSVEQALFKLINEERAKNQLNELQWGDNLYGWADANSRDMAQSQSYKYSDYATYQQVYWATGYGTADSTAVDALTVWQNSQQYETIFLNSILTYGAVSVFKSGDILYITFISDRYK